jgi:hypothetical protein
MARKNLYEYAVLYQPKATRDAMGNDTTPDTELIIPLSEKLASSEKELTILAAREIPEKYLDKLNEVEVIVRALIPQ